MKKKIFTLLTLLATVCSGAWAAGYTLTLSNELEVSGYLTGTLYNFQSNSPEVLPTSGDLRYRSDGGIWGLHNYGSGTRSATVTISVTEGDLLVLQDYSASYPTTVNVGTLDESKSSSTGYRCFNITSTATSITLTCPRYGGVVAALLMSADPEASTAKYTVKYVDGEGTEIKDQVEYEGTVGADASVPSSDKNPIYANDKKYIYSSDDSDGKTIVEGGTTIVTVTFREAATYSYTVNSKCGELTLATTSTTGFEGDVINFNYPNFINYEGTLYSKDATSKQFTYSFTLSSDNQVETLEYTITSIEDVVYYSEVESITGATVQNNGGCYTRTSSCATGYANNLEIVTLPAGQYKFTVYFYNSSSSASTVTITDGTNTLYTNDFAQLRNSYTSESSVVLTSSTTLYITGGNTSTNNPSGIDLVYIQKTGEAVEAVSVTDAKYATYVPTYDLNFTSSTIKAYKAKVASAGVVTLTQVNNVPAGTPVVLYNAEGALEENIPVMTGAAAVSDNDLVAGTGAAVATTDGEYTNLVLDNQDSNVGFYYAAGLTVASTQAYLHIDTSLAPAGARMIMVFDENGTTGINSIESQKAQANGEYYNLAGQRVAQPTKGLYIVNGKKVVMK